jgi:[ribosomal protein S5]-alanine N-acetyltransferase
MLKNHSPFLQFPTIKTQRLTLRHLRPEDEKAIFAYKNQEEGECFPRVEHHDDISDSQLFIASCLRKYYTKSGIFWGIVEGSNDTVIGTVALCAMHGDPIIEYRAEISCALSKAYRQKKIMTEARIAIINYAFSTWQGLTRIHSEIAVSNIPSLKMNKKLGFVNEGILRSYQKDNGQFYDIKILSLLRRDWKKNPIYRSVIS